MVKKAGRPKKQIDEAQLKALMRLKPTLDDCAAFFECHPETIINFIKRTYCIEFSKFREQNMVHTRFMLVRTAIAKAQKGDNTMLIFCLKNLCDWRDRPADEEENPFKEMSKQDLIVYVQKQLQLEPAQ